MTLALLVLLINACAAIAQNEKVAIINPEGTAEFTAKAGLHQAKLVFTTRLFIPSGHRIVLTGDCVRIDGHVPLGTDCGIPQVEIAAMRLFIDGNEIAIPRNLYSDCYSPPSFKAYKETGIMDKYLAMKYSDDKQGVFVFLAGGDGAAVYDVIWILRKDGHHSRFTNSGGDCRFLNFECPLGS